MGGSGFEAGSEYTGMVLLTRGERGPVFGKGTLSGVAIRGGVELLRDWEDKERVGGRWPDVFWGGVDGRRG